MQWWNQPRTMSRPMSRDKADMLLLLAACTLVLAPHAMHLPVWESVICSLLLLWRGWITLHGNRLPPRWLLIPIAAVTMVIVLKNYGTWIGRDAGVAMLAILLTLKLLEMRARRDLFVVVLLSFFLILTRFFYAQTITTALMTIVTVVAIMTAQLSFQYTGVQPRLKQRLRLGLSICALGIPLALILFVLFPRIQGPLWGMPSDANAGRTGLSDTMSPGKISHLAQSDEIAFRAKFDGAPPAKSKRYWRAIVLDHYDGTTWSIMRDARHTQSPIEITPRSAPLHYQVTLEASGQRWLYALDLPAAAPQLLGNPVIFSSEVELMAAQAINQRVRYDATSFLDYTMQPNASLAVLWNWLQLPRGYNPRTLQFATQLRHQYEEPVQIVNAVLQFFRQQPFVYTLEPPLLGRDAVDEFLFSTRAGFCEHYSGAFVVLMRAAGIPARVVTGYQGGEINPVDGFMTVRQSDAHAWAEVWLENRGWVRVDPTAAVAPERIEKNLDSVIPRQTYLDSWVGPNLIAHASWLGTLRANWEAVNNHWNQWVLNYTPQQQKALIRKLGLDDSNWGDMIILMVVLGSLTMAVIGYGLTKSREKIDPINAIYARLSRQMAKRGLARAAHEGPVTWRDRLISPQSPLTPLQKQGVMHFMNLYITVQYNSTELSRSQAVAQLKSLLLKCR